MYNKLVRKSELMPNNHVSGRHFERFVLPILEERIISVLCRYNDYDDNTMKAVRVGVRYSVRHFFKLTGLVKL